MANENGRTAPELIKHFVTKSHRFGFYQAIRWLGNVSKALQEQGHEPFKIRVLPQLSLDFIGNDIRSATYDEKSNTIELTVTFLALYGTASPLPTFYTEDLMLEISEDITVAKDFLDIFHKILYQKLYDVWLKYRLNQCAFEAVDQKYINKLYHLVGLGDKTLRQMVPGAKSLIKYIGLFNQQPRSSKNLEILLKDYFEVSAKVKCGHRTTQKMSSSQLISLGEKNAKLGQEVYLGSQVKDVSSSISIEIFELSTKEFNLFSHRQPYCEALSFLVKFFCNVPIKSFVTIYLKSGEVEACKLGLKEWSKLGQNAWASPEGDVDYSAHYEIV
ncbi:type VI secretion system baseplate subunit TssG [Francisellaceae bacterium]|nr:type VI secretion system baseplate subunit TssG [Francisellaceae bacterium]